MEDFDIDFGKDEENLGLRDEIADYEERAARNEGSDSEDENAGMSKISRVKFKEKILMEQLYKKYLLS